MVTKRKPSTTPAGPKATKPAAKGYKPKKQSYDVARKGIIARSKAKFGHAPTEAAVRHTYAKYNYLEKPPTARPKDGGPGAKRGVGLPAPKPPNNTIARPKMPPSTPIDYGTISAPPTGATRKKAPGSPAVRAPGTTASKIRKM